MACDELAASTLADPLTYARALTRLEELRAPLALAPAANGGQLMDRIRRVVGLQRNPGRSRWPLPALVGAGALGLISAAAIAASDPQPQEEAEEPAPQEEATEDVARETAAAATLRASAGMEVIRVTSSH